MFHAKKKFRLKDKNILKVRVPVVNIDLAYPEEQWQQIKSTSGDGHVSLTLHILIFEYWEWKTDGLKLQKFFIPH